MRLKEIGDFFPDRSSEIYLREKCPLISLEGGSSIGESRSYLMSVSFMQKPEILTLVMPFMLVSQLSGLGALIGFSRSCTPHWPHS